MKRFNVNIFNYWKDRNKFYPFNFSIEVLNYEFKNQIVEKTLITNLTILNFCLLIQFKIKGYGI